MQRGENLTIEILRKLSSMLKNPNILIVNKKMDVKKLPTQILPKL